MDSSNSTFPSGISPSTTSHIKSGSSSKETTQNNLKCTFLIIGGGIAGVSCAEAINFLAQDEKVVLLTESSLIKTVNNLVQLGKYIQQFDVMETDADELSNENIQVVRGKLEYINSSDKMITTVNGSHIKYKFLCICTGAKPSLIPNDNDDFVLGIRDTDSVKEFQKRLKSGQKFCLVGNGGIASEIVYEIDNIEIDWVIKDRFISSKFIDAAAAKFLESKLNKNDTAEAESTIVKRMRFCEETSGGNMAGAALGPDWHHLFDMSGTSTKKVKIHYECEVESVTRVSDGEHAIAVKLTNGTEIKSDFIISATGVHPCTTFNCDEVIKVTPDGGICVNELMRTSIDAIYAAGDVCYADWDHSKFWLQMNLWTQARQMGMMAAKSMVAQHQNKEIYQDFCFELFSHVTKLYGYKMVLLGKFNAQDLENNYELLFRITPDKEYIKFVIKEKRLVGALLIGETGLEETCENLILNQIDLTPYGDDILNPNIDIEDYFD